MSVFSLFEQVLGYGRKRSAEIPAPKRYERKRCKSCMFFWSNKCIGIFTRDPWGKCVRDVC